MSEISLCVTVYAFTLVASYCKTFIHESGHVMALVLADRSMIRRGKKNNLEYTPQKYYMKSRLGDGRIDSPLYGILVETQRYGWLRLSAASGMLAELFYCAVLFFITFHLFGKCTLAVAVPVILFGTSLTAFFVDAGKKGSDFHILFHPQLFGGDMQEDFYVRDLEKAGHKVIWSAIEVILVTVLTVSSLVWGWR